jgi:hypothetical protein
MLLTDNPAKKSTVGQSGAQVRAVQTLREGDECSVNAKRLDCVRFTAAFALQEICWSGTSIVCERHNLEFIWDAPRWFLKKGCKRIASRPPLFPCLTLRLTK